MVFSSSSISVLLVLSAAHSAIAQDKQPQPKTLELRNIQLQVPASWKQIDTSSQMRLAQFEIAAEQDGKKHAENSQAAELVVYYFGGGATGGIKANVERWIGQFHEEGRSVNLLQGKSTKIGHQVQRSGPIQKRSERTFRLARRLFN